MSAAKLSPLMALALCDIVAAGRAHVAFRCIDNWDAKPWPNMLTLQALERRGLVEHDPGTFLGARPTALGREVAEERFSSSERAAIERSFAGGAK